MNLAVTGVGAVSPVGASAAETCASIRAGIVRFRAWPFFRPQPEDPLFQPAEPLIASAVTRGISEPSAQEAGARRCHQLARVAVQELIESMGMRRQDLPHTAMLVATWDGWSEQSFSAAELCVSLGLNQLGGAGLLHGGHTVGFGALRVAGEALAKRQVPRVLLVFVDSFLDTARLRMLDQAGRIKSPRNVDGFVPGEAAFALSVELAELVRARGETPRALLGLVGSADERQPAGGERESSATGLCEAIRQALPSMPGARPSLAICDLNGESYRHHDWAVAATRLAPSLGIPLRILHPADCLGDVGAAAAGASLALAIAALERGWAGSDPVLVWGASDGHRRAAVLVSRGASPVTVR